MSKFARMKKALGVMFSIGSIYNPKDMIGTFSPQLREFIRLLKKYGVKYIQILPLSKLMGLSNSPYGLCSAYAQEINYICLDIFKEKGLLDEETLNQYQQYLKNNSIEDDSKIDYGVLFELKLKILRIIYDNFKKLGCERDKDSFSSFCRENDEKWLDDFSLYMVLKMKYKWSSWREWPKVYRDRDKNALEGLKKSEADDLEFIKWTQFTIFTQIRDFISYANSIGIDVIGDMPIYLQDDSVELWAQPQMFEVDENKKLKYVSGYEDQVWGGPLYRYDVQKQDGYKWWIDRIRWNLKLCNILRLDHYQGYISYYKINAKSVEDNKLNKNVKIQYEKCKGPGLELFDKVFQELGDVKLIAEDLGTMTEEIKNSKDALGLPGMKVYNYFLENQNDDNPHNPEMVDENCVYYSATADSNTSIGLYDEVYEKCKESGNWGILQNMEKVYGVYNRQYSDDGICFISEFMKNIIDIICSSKANLAMVLVQDLLCIPTRYNVPGQPFGNWNWKMTLEDWDNFEKYMDIYYPVIVKSGRVD